MSESGKGTDGPKRGAVNDVHERGADAKASGEEENPGRREHGRAAQPPKAEPRFVQRITDVEPHPDHLAVSHAAENAI